MIGTRRGPSAVADGWGCALCMEITNQASWWIPAKPVLLLRLWPRRRCDSLCRALSPGAVPASPGTAAPLAWRDAFTAGSCEFLWHAVTPSCRGGCLSAAPRTPLAGTDRAHAHRLRAGRLPARLVDAVGLPAPGS